jgi:mono/diheme cytochrome c family protein
MSSVKRAGAGLLGALVVAVVLGLGLLGPRAGLSQQAPAGESGKGSSPTVGGPTPAGGVALYTKYCAQCHGDKGDGHGIAAPVLRPMPRDFTSGKYQIRSTETGNLPTDDDIRRIIQRGIPSTAMPAFAEALNDDQIDQLAQYVKTFSPKFKSQPAGKLVPIPKDPGYKADQVEAARKVYQSIGCARCHGDEGRGDGPSAPTLKDDWGQEIRPADLSRPWTFNGGATREDIFRSISTGLNGTPMAGFASALTDEQRWSLVDFVTSLAGGPDRIGKADYGTIVVAQKVDGPLDLAKGTKLFADAKPALFPLLGQIIQPGREFAPGVIAVQARAVYNADNVALLLTWHDIHADTSGNNGPDFELPEQEEHPGPEVSAPAGGGQTTTDPFAEEESGGGAAAAPAKPASADPFAEEEAAPAAKPTPAKPAAGAAGGGDSSFWGEPGGGGAAAAASAAEAGGSEFSDAVAVQFPRTLPDGVRRPYFIFGDPQDSVELWFVDLAHPQKAELWEGKGTQDLNPGEGMAPEVRATYDHGEWQVLMLRKRDVGHGVSFPDDTFVPISFSVWDGFYRERGNKRALTTWYNLYVPPAEKPSPWVPMAKAAGAVLLLELVIIGLARRRARRVSRAGVAAPAMGTERL